MAAPTKLYPRGRLALGSGDLIDVVNVKLTHTSNAKQVHTLRQRGAGIVLGNQETTVSFEIAISDQGEERDWFEMLEKGLIKQLRIKVPGRTITVNGACSKCDVDIPLDDAIKYMVEFVGRLER
jgi:hypothetical protein